MNFKKTLIRISFLFLALMVLASCTKTSIQDETRELEIYESDKGDAGSIGNSDGDDSDNDYN